MIRLVIIKINMGNRSFALNWKFAEIACKSYVDDSWLWHKRYMHVNMASSKFLQKEGLIRDMPLIHTSDELCVKWGSNIICHSHLTRAREQLRSYN